MDLNETRRGFLLSAGALAACQRAPAATTTVRIGYQKNGVLLLAKTRGILPARLAASGVTQVQWAEFGAGPPLLEAMRAGAIDLGLVGDTPPIFAQAAGAPIVYAAAQTLTGQGEGLVVPANSSVRSLAELKGRRIGFTKASSAHLFVVRALATVGLTLKDITPVYLSPADAAAAFSAGALDAWAIWDPFFALVEARHNARLILDGRGVTPSNSFYVARQAFAERSPKVLASLLDALAGEAAWGDAHLDQAGAIVQKATGLPADVLTAVLHRGVYDVAPMTPAIIQAQQASADLFFHLGVTPKPIDIRQAVWSGWTPTQPA
jgi:sulfonate transport system substrate-binding protein